MAERVRPEAVGEVVGQQQLVGDDKPLAAAIARDQLHSMILWGPPGCGKTTLARVIAASTQATFVPFSAVLGGVGEVRKIVAAAAERRSTGGGSTVLFVDEIHRFNKAQQDAFLPHVEDGTVTLIGATTDNPSFSLNAPLLSRCVVYRLQPLSEAEMVELLRRALVHPAGFSGDPVTVDDEALAGIARAADGDARRALQTLDLAVERAQGSGVAQVDLPLLRSLATEKTLRHDRQGDEHYDIASAFIKSLRGSDPDAALYWMMRLLEAGDDPLFVLRRMLIFASEDIGNADPRGLTIAVDADRAFRRLGMPEGIYPMAQACTYLACAPKSNAANIGWHRAQGAVKKHGSLPVPLKLRNAPTALMRQQGHGRDYRYPHDEPDGVARGETYLPEALLGRERFYQPADRGFEIRIRERLARLRGKGQ